MRSVLKPAVGAMTLAAVFATTAAGQQPAPGDGEEFDAEDEEGSGAGFEGGAETADVGHRGLRGKAIA